MKLKAYFYMAQYPVRWTTQSALHFAPPPPPPCRYVHSMFIPAPTHLLDVKHSSSNYVRRLIAHFSTTVYSQLLIQLSELGHCGENENDHTLKRLQRRFKRRLSLDGKSAVLPLSYHGVPWRSTHSFREAFNTLL